MQCVLKQALIQNQQQKRIISQTVIVSFIAHNHLTAIIRKKF